MPDSAILSALATSLVVVVYGALRETQLHPFVTLPSAAQVAVGPGFGRVFGQSDKCTQPFGTSTRPSHRRPWRPPGGLRGNSCMAAQGHRFDRRGDQGHALGCPGLAGPERCAAMK